MCADALAALAAAETGLQVRFSASAGVALLGVPYQAVVAILVPLWVVVLAAGGAYERRFLASGADEYRRVLNSGIWLTACAVFTAFVLHASVSRVVVALT